MNWTVFTDLTTSINSKIDPAVDNIINGTTSWAASWLKAALLLYLIYHAVMISAGRTRNNPADLVIQAVKMSLALWIATQTTAYDTYFKNLFLTQIPGEITSAISGAMGTSAITGSVFDKMLAKVFIVGLVVWKHLSWDAAGISMGLCTLAYWIIATVAVTFAYIVWETSHVFLSLMIAVGPMFVAFILFSLTRPMFERWLGAVMGFVLAQVFIVALLTILIAAETSNLAQLVTDVTSDPIQQVQLMISGIALFVVCGVIAYAIPGAASTIAGGVHFAGAAVIAGMAGYLAAKASNPPGGGGGKERPRDDSGDAAYDQQFGDNLGGMPIPAGMSLSIAREALTDESPEPGRLGNESHGGWRFPSDT